MPMTSTWRWDTVQSNIPSRPQESHCLSAQSMLATGDEVGGPRTQPFLLVPNRVRMGKHRRCGASSRDADSNTAADLAQSQPICALPSTSALGPSLEAQRSLSP